MNFKIILCCLFAVGVFAKDADEGWQKILNPVAEKLYRQHMKEDSAFINSIKDYFKHDSLKKVWNKKYPALDPFIAGFFKRDSIFEIQLAKQEQKQQDSLLEVTKIILELEFEKQMFAKRSQILTICKR